MAVMLMFIDTSQPKLGTTCSCKFGLGPSLSKSQKIGCFSVCILSIKQDLQNIIVMSHKAAIMIMKL